MLLIITILRYRHSLEKKMPYITNKYAVKGNLTHLFILKRA